MSLENYEEFMIDKLDDDKYFKMIYKPNENKENIQNRIFKLKDEDAFDFDDEKDYNEDVIRILGKYFIKQNENKCKLIYNNKKYRLNNYFNEIDNNYDHNINEIKLKIIGINNITDFGDMFHGSFYLSSVSESKHNIEQRISNSYNIFNNNNNPYLLFELIGKKNANEGNNININTNYELYEEFKESIDFYNECILSQSENISSIKTNLSDYSYKNSDNIIYIYQALSTNNNYNNKLKKISRMFYGCISLKTLPDLSNWDTSSVIEMNHMFCACKSLISLPDISKWDTSNIIYMSAMFVECRALISLPDISKWNTSNVTDMSGMFFGCRKFISIPDISQWNISNVNDISFMFSDCYSLILLPDLSLWDISNVTNMNSLFEKCHF